MSITDVAEDFGRLMMDHYLNLRLPHSLYFLNLHSICVQLYGYRQREPGMSGLLEFTEGAIDIVVCLNDYAVRSGAQLESTFEGEV